MRPYWSTASWFVVVCGLIVGSHFTVGLKAAETATSPELRQAVRALVDDAWTKTADGLSKAEAAYRKAAQLAPGDDRIEFAWALVQLRYLRFDDAEKTLADLLRNSPDHWEARRLQIRLFAQAKRHSASLTAIEQLSERLGTANVESRPDDRRETIEFLGRMFAFYQGPAGKGTVPSAVAELRNRVVERLSVTEREQFEQSFSGIQEQFTQLTAEKERSAEAAKAAEESAKTNALKKLEIERAAIDSEKESVQKQAADVEGQAREAVAKLDGQLGPIDAELARINAVGAGLRREIDLLDVSIAELLALADRTKSESLRANYVGQANVQTARLRRLNFDYSVLDGQAAQLNVRRNALLQERQALVARYEATMRALGQTAAKLNRDEKRVNVQTGTALKPATGDSPLVRSQATAAASLSTYVDLSLEREKSRLLASFEK